MRARSTLFLAAGLLCSAASPARAADPSAAHAEAQGRFRSGVELSRQQRWDEALAEFQTAATLAETKLTPVERDRVLPAILYEIGLAAGHLPKATATACDAFERYLAKPPARPTPAAIEHAQQFLAEHAGEVGKLVFSGPAGARVYLDQRLLGALPFPRAQLASRGVHTIELSAAGWLPDPLREEVAVGGGATVHVDLRQHLRRAPPGTLLIRSGLPGVRVVVDGVESALTAELDPGEHLVVVSRQGYVPFEATAKIETGGRTTIDAKLKIRPGLRAVLMGTLKLTLDLPGAVASLDGELAPALLQGGLQVPIGPHELGVTVPAGGYQPWTRRVELESGTQPLIEVVLVRSGP